MSRIHRGRFRRGEKYVVVNPFRVSSKEMMKVGTVVPSEDFPLGVSHLRSLFRRRRIGHLDSDWANSMLARQKDILKKESDARIAAKKVISDSAETGSGGGDTTIVNVLDPSLVGDFLTSPSGERVLINVIEETAAEEKAAEDSKKSKKSKSKSKK